MAESAVPIRRPKPQLQLFIPWCAGHERLLCRHERLVRKHVPDDPGCPYAASISASESHESPGSSFRRKPESRGVGRGECSAVEDFARRGVCPPLGRRRGVAESAVPIRRPKPQLQLFIPWCAGPCRHERLLRKHVPDYDPGWPTS